MSDVAVAPTPEVEAPVVEPVVTPAPEPVVEAPVDTRTAPERLAAIKERGRGVRPEPTVAEQINAVPDQPRDSETGKFVSAEEVTEQPVEEPVAPEVPVEGATELTVETTPEEFIEILIPEGNPLRARGLEKLPFQVPAEHEEVARSLVNQAMSKKEVELLRTKTADAERLALESKAETEFWRDNVGEVFGADFQAKYQDIKGTYGDEDAELYKQGELAKAQGKIAEMRDQAYVEARNARQEFHSKEFRQLALRDALHGLEAGGPRYPGWSMDGPHGADQALGFYGAELDAIERETGIEQYPDSRRWHEIAGMYYQSHPAGLQANEARDAGLKEALRKEVEGQATQREKEALEAARTTAADNPLAALPPVETGHTTTPRETPLTAPEVMKQIRDRAKGLLT